MAVALEDELREVLSSLGVALVTPDSPLWGDLRQGCASLRRHLLELETKQVSLPLSGGSYWDISPKYRLDVLTEDIQHIANQLGFSIGFSSLYLPRIHPGKIPYCPSFADEFFWYHINFGFRLASSGWDRIALLLDLAFGLNLREKCGLRSVLKELPKCQGMDDKGKSYIALKRFRDQRFTDLEAKQGRGARHETTHLLSPSTRYLFEFLETVVGGARRMPPELEGKARRDALIVHHGFYLQGVQHTIDLVSSRWPSP
ncbi:MAG: hypothetical protein M1274_15325 [Actinobacteria bacterium]|nr:hypothetical protein [Actinomycetota bacterium]